MGAMLFAVLAVAAQLDRDHIREKIQVSGFSTSKRRHREALTIAEAAILTLTGTSVSD